MVLISGYFKNFSNMHRTATIFGEELHLDVTVLYNLAEAYSDHIWMR